VRWVTGSFGVVAFDGNLDSLTATLGEKKLHTRPMSSQVQPAAMRSDLAASTYIPRIRGDISA
jgi:hypothetical protein